MIHTDDTVLRDRPVPKPPAYFWDSVRTWFVMLFLLGLCVGMAAFWLYVPTMGMWLLVTLGRIMR